MGWRRESTALPELHAMGAERGGGALKRTAAGMTVLVVGCRHVEL